MQNEIKLLNEATIFDTYLAFQILKRLTTPFNKTEAYKLGIIDDKGNILKKRRTLKTYKEKEALTQFDIFIFNIKKIIERLPFGRSLLANYAAAFYLMREEKNLENYQDEDIVYEGFMDFFDAIVLNEEDRTNLSNFILTEAKKQFSKSEAKRIGTLLDVDWEETDLEQFRIGLGIESEHDSGEFDVVGGDKKKLAKIVLAHLDELPDYYTKLIKMEEDAPANAVGTGAIAGTTGDPPIKIRKKKKSFKKFIEN